MLYLCSMIQEDIDQKYIKYTGKPESVENLMKAFGRTVGFNNSPDGLYLDGIRYPKGTVFSIRTVKTYTAQ